MGKTALDLVLLAQTEVGEVVAGAGGSSTMAHKRNPVGAVRARACAARVPALAALLLAAMAQAEHERAAGAWHAEWEPFAQALGLTGGAAAGVARDARGARGARRTGCGRNLEATGGRLLPERIVLALAPAAGRAEAVGAVQAAAAADGAFRDALLDQPVVAEHLDAAGARRSARSRRLPGRDRRADRARARALRARDRDARVMTDDRYEAGMRVRREVLGDAHVDRATDRATA